MSDLPARDEIDWESIPLADVWTQKLARVARAYKNRRLMTRAEWEAEDEARDAKTLAEALEASKDALRGHPDG